MDSESESVGAETFFFSCPHCQGRIRFDVDALQKNDTISDINVDFDYDEEWATGDWRKWEAERAKWTPFYNSVKEVSQLIYIREYAEALSIIHNSLSLMVDILDSEESDYVSVGHSGQLFTEGARTLAFMGDIDGLNRMHEIAQSVPEFKRSVVDVEKYRREVGMFQSIREAVRNNPNCLQTEVKLLINEVDGHHVARLIAFMDKAGEIIRVREGRKIRLSLASNID